MSLRTVIYLRKSTQDKDEKQIHSIARQEEDVRDFIERYNKMQPPEERLVFDEDRDMVKEDASAKYPGRRKFNEMIKLIQKRRYEVLLCAELSRLSRNAVDTGTLVQLLEDKHLKKIQTKDKVFTVIPTDKFTLALFLTVSKFENDQRALNTMSGMAHQKGRGVTTHKAPMGYINAGEIKGNKWVEFDPETGESVRKIWELFLTGDYSIPDLKRKGDAMGITVFDRGGRHFPVDTTFRGMLRNKYYCGFIRKVDTESGKVLWIKGQHPAMVSEQEFNKAQLILQSRGYKHQPVTDEVSINTILNELVVCGKCETEVKGLTKPTKMVFEDKSRYTCSRCKFRFSSAAASKPCPKCGAPVTDDTKIDVHQYFRCGKRYSSDACTHDFYGTGKQSKNVRSKDIEHYLDQQISKLHISDGLFEVLRRQLYTLWLDENQNIKNQKEMYRKALLKLEDERTRIQRKWLDESTMTDVEKEDREHILDANKEEQNDWQDKINDLKESEEEKFEKGWQSLNILKEAKSLFAEPKIGIEPKRQLILSLISNLKITDNNWEVIWKKPFAELAKVGIAKRGRSKSYIGSDSDKFKWLPRLDSNQ